MESTPRTYRELSEISGLPLPSIRRWVKNLQAAGFAHVAGYAPDRAGRMFVPMWAWGAGADAARPGPRRTAAERMRDSRARRKAA